jgi:hypothetical protein
MTRRSISLAWALAGAALIGAALLPATTAFAADVLPASPDAEGTPTFTTEGGVNGLRTTRTVPYWSSSFTDPTNQVTYPFTMVGSDPRLGGSTSVPTEIIPLRFNFVAGSQDVTALGASATALSVSMDATGNAADVVSSPIFTNANFPISSDAGVQYGDAVMRAQFGKVGTGYHVVLGQPLVMPSVSIDVPEGLGVAVLNSKNVLVGRVDMPWFRTRLHNLLGSLHIDPTTLPIFLTQNVYLYSDRDFTHCCGIGGHGAGSPTGNGGGPVNGKGNQPVQTFAWAAYITPNSFRSSGLSDIHSLSHEISEWMDNPFGVNTVQPYVIPTSRVGACDSALETGDAVTGVWFPIPNPSSGGFWHPSDEVFLNWFARNGEDPALAPALDPANLRYTYMGFFKQPAQAC